MVLFISQISFQHGNTFITRIQSVPRVCHAEGRIENFIDRRLYFDFKMLNFIVLLLFKIICYLEENNRHD